MPLKVSLRALTRAIIAGSLFCGCASGRLSGASETQLVEEDVPRLLQGWLPQAGPIAAGDRIAARAAGLRSEAWFVEELKGHANYRIFDAKYAGREYILKVPKERLHKPEADWDFSTFAMVGHWTSWSTLLGGIFLPAGQEFDRVAVGHYFRVIAPATDRIYDVVIIRPVNMNKTLIADPISGGDVERLWKAINPPKADEFPRSSIFGPTRFVEPTAAKRFTLGPYNVLESYAKRYFAGGSFLHAEYGRSRGRDTYILALLSQNEIVVLQTVLYGDANVETLLDDLRSLIGSK